MGGNSKSTLNTLKHKVLHVKQTGAHYGHVLYLTGGSHTMDVKITRLGPMRVGAVRAFGEAPEREAWERLRRWAGARGLLADSGGRPIFGFNNPGPSPGRAEYGYELWIAVDADAAAEPGIEIKHFPGGSFAVAVCRLQEIGETWKGLWAWAQSRGYRWRRTHELERVVNPDAAESEMKVELYLPVEEERRG